VARFTSISSFFTAIFLFSAAGCSHLVYQPHPEVLSEPRRVGLEYLEVEIPSLDGTRLRAWLFPAKGSAPRRGTFVQFHGNAENRTTHFASLVWVTQHGYDLLAFDYRGYGGSEGRPDQHGLNQDALAAILWAAARDPREPLLLYGQSLGGAVLMRALQDIGDPELRARIRLVVVDSSFYSYRAIARDMVSRFWFSWWLQPFVALLLSDAYSPGDAIRWISPLPLVVVHGDEDGVIPLSFGEEIFRRAGEPKEFWKVEGGHHIDAMSRPAFRERLMAKLGERQG
jgi:fermentation-respiration switch protein FrsA (DUF1100 family)